MRNNFGQSLIELIVVVTVIVVVVGALVFAVIASIRNAQFAKNQAQATKLAQEGLERTRSVRNRNGSISFIAQGIRDWNFFWTNSTSVICGSASCPLKLKSSGCAYELCQITGVASAQEDVYGDKRFARTIIVEDGASFDVEKKVTSIVTWNDFSGSHESRLTTFLRKL